MTLNHIDFGPIPNLATMLDAKNTKTQGDIGVGQAIAWFTRNGYTVSIPLTDNQAYDLIVDKDNQIYRVQVKTTKFKKHNHFYISLIVKGGNKSCSTAKRFDHDIVELLFIFTNDNEQYLIPTKEINRKQTLSLGLTYQKFRV